jgi:N-acetylneuraminate synthase/N,N'-diacetyllegionaminate synthase
LKIGNFDTDKKVLIIAEIGNNHEGDFELAKEMIDAAAEAGADAVKFQTITPNRLVSITEQERIRQLQRFSFDRDQFATLKERADEKKVYFLSTPFDLEAVDWLNPLVPAFKIASGDNDFWPLLEKIASTGKPIILSLGLGKVKEATQIASFFKKTWSRSEITFPGLALLHCVVCYPTPIDQANLQNIIKIECEHVTPGYSDHTLGIKAAELAVACGARIIEKHFTLNKNQSDFRDHKLSADSSELKALVQAIADVEKFLGKTDNAAAHCEKQNATAVGRSIASNRDIRIGETISIDDICWIRPRKGLKPGEEHLIIGKKLSSPIYEGEFFSLKHFE